MDWTVAIERNGQALKRLLATLVAMASLPVLCGGERLTLPRHLHRAVLRLLRPAESATRRLVIIAARGLIIRLPPPRHRKGKPNPTILRHGIGTGIRMPNRPTLPRRTLHRLSLPLFDPMRRPSRPFRPAASSTPRICFPGLRAPSPVPVRHSPDPYDLIDAGRLGLRLAALASALDDLPAQAKRFARWRARVAAGRQTSTRVRRIWPLRPGRPPGGLKRSVHDVHDLLNDIHGLAWLALERPDTS